MAQLVLVMTHPPDQCPATNSTIRKLMSNAQNDLPRLSKKFGIRFAAGPLVTNEHRIFAVVEADKVEGVNDFLLETGLLQWNSTEIIPGQPINEGMEQISKLKPLY